MARPWLVEYPKARIERAADRALWFGTPKMLASNALGMSCQLIHCNEQLSELAGAVNGRGGTRTKHCDRELQTRLVGIMLCGRAFHAGVCLTTSTPRAEAMQSAPLCLCKMLEATRISSDCRPQMLQSLTKVGACFGGTVSMDTPRKSSTRRLSGLWCERLPLTIPAQVYLKLMWSNYANWGSASQKGSPDYFPTVQPTKRRFAKAGPRATICSPKMRVRDWSCEGPPVIISVHGRTSSISSKFGRRLLPRRAAGAGTTYCGQIWSRFCRIWQNLSNSWPMSASGARQLLPNCAPGSISRVIVEYVRRVCPRTGTAESHFAFVWAILEYIRGVHPSTCALGHARVMLEYLVAASAAPPWAYSPSESQDIASFGGGSEGSTAQVCPEGTPLGAGGHLPCLAPELSDDAVVWAGRRGTS